MLSSSTFSILAPNPFSSVPATFLDVFFVITSTVIKFVNPRAADVLFSVEVITKNTSRKVAGTLLNGVGARIVKVDDYSKIGRAMSREQVLIYYTIGI